MATENRSRAVVSSPNRRVAALAGLAYLALGLLGFVATAEIGFVDVDGALLLGLRLNPLQNVVHILIGAALLASGLLGLRAAKRATGITGGLFLVLGIHGLFAIDTDLNLLALNGAANVLHLASSIVLLAVALGADKVTSIRAT